MRVVEVREGDRGERNAKGDYMKTGLMRNGVTQKTNAARLLDQVGIGYELREYEVDPEDSGLRLLLSR